MPSPEGGERPYCEPLLVEQQRVAHLPRPGPPFATIPPFPASPLTSPLSLSPLVLDTVMATSPIRGSGQPTPLPRTCVAVFPCGVVVRG